MKQPFETMPTVLTADEIVGKMLRESDKVEVELPQRLPAIMKAKRRESSRVRACERVSTGYLESLVRSVPTIERLHPFYREILELQCGVANVRSSLGRISRAARVIHEIAKDASRRIRSASTPQEAGKARRAFLGRAASIIRDTREDLELIAAMREKMKDLPAADPSVPTVVLAGYPGVGKSTILRTISRAKPEVRPYPFTTKELMIGHVLIGRHLIQVVDTPGILDRPIDEMNQTERLSITALGRLADLIAFIVDASEANGFSLESQQSLRSGISGAFPGLKILTFLNKADAAGKEQLDRATAIFGESDLMAAAKGEGLEAFKKRVLDALGPLDGPEWRGEGI
ncbi:MAG: GTPase [Candidatus Methanosuratincola sp.]